VWIVSIPSEGGGVDLGTWQENQDVEDVISLPDSETESDIVGNEMRPPSIPLSSPPLRVSPLQELHGGEAAPSSTSSATEASLPSCLSSPASHRRQITDSALLVPSPSSPKRRPCWRHETHSSHSPIGSGGSGTGGVEARVGAGPALVIPGGGFQIGLSPVSPGFAILPRLRRKRVVSGNSIEGGTVEGTQRNRTLRSFSDSDMNRDRTLSPRGADVGVGARGDTREDGTAENDVEDQISPRRRGWKWLKNVLTRRGRSS
jgi:hypothetical protein